MTTALLSMKNYFRESFCVQFKALINVKQFESHFFMATHPSKASHLFLSDEDKTIQSEIKDEEESFFFGHGQRILIQTLDA